MTEGNEIVVYWVQERRKGGDDRCWWFRSDMLLVKEAALNRLPTEELKDTEYRVIEVRLPFTVIA